MALPLKVTKTKTKILKDPTCAIFLKMIWLKNIKYDDGGWISDAPSDWRWCTEGDALRWCIKLFGPFFWRSIVPEIGKCIPTNINFLCFFFVISDINITIMIMIIIILNRHYHHRYISVLRTKHCFWCPKKRTKLPELGGWGGVIWAMPERKHFLKWDLP